MDRFVYTGFKFTGLYSWLRYTRNAVTSLVIGLISLLYAIVAGFVTVVYKFGLFLAGKIRKYPLFSFVAITVILTIVMVVNFVSLSIKAKTYEYQRDSIGYELLLIKENCVTQDTTNKIGEK